MKYKYSRAYISVHYSYNKVMLVLCANFYTVQVCTGHLLAVVCQHFQMVNVLKFTDDGTYLLSGGADARVLVWKFGR